MTDSGLCFASVASVMKELTLLQYVKILNMYMSCVGVNVLNKGGEAVCGERFASVRGG